MRSGYEVGVRYAIHCELHFQAVCIWDLRPFGFDRAFGICLESDRRASR